MAREKNRVEYVFAAVSSMRTISRRCVRENEWEKAGQFLLSGCELLMRLHPEVIDPFAEGWLVLMCIIFTDDQGNLLPHVCRRPAVQY